MAPSTKPSASPQGLNQDQDQDFVKMLPKRAMIILSSVHIAIGLVAFCFFVVIADDVHIPITDPIACFTPVSYGLAGLVGLLTAYKPTQCDFIFFQMMNIVAVSSCVFSMLLRVRFEDDEHFLQGPLFLVIFLETLVSITCVALTCGACCCYCCRTPKNRGQVDNNPNVEAQNTDFAIPGGFVSNEEPSESNARPISFSTCQCRSVN